MKLKKILEAMEKQGTVWLIVVFFLIGLSVLMPSDSEADIEKPLEKAMVKSDRAPLFSEMSTESSILSFLAQGEAVLVKFRIEGSEGTWCAVAKAAEQGNRGYLQCRHLSLKETPEGSWQTVGASIIQSGSETSKVTVKHNAVLVPTALSYKGRKVEALLLLDTGSSRTVISTETAGRLNIDLTEGRKGRIQVVGGTFVEALPVRLDAIAFGPHFNKHPEILVIEHKGPSANYDGLLGMDLLKGLRYRIDFDRQIIRWE